MTNAQRHNFRLARRAVHGLNKVERIKHYTMVRLGPLSIIANVILSATEAAQANASAA